MPARTKRSRSGPKRRSAGTRKSAGVTWRSRIRTKSSEKLGLAQVIRASWHPLAKRELFEGADFYEARADGLDEAFLAAIESAIARIRRHPRSGPLVLGSIR